jgi:membrane-bound lytic murein transglycosylase B
MRWALSNNIMKKLIFLLLFIVLNPVVSLANTEEFQTWLKGLKVRLEAQGISSHTIEKYLPDDIELLPKVIALDRTQPEHKLTYSQYYKRVVSPELKEKARKSFELHKDKLLEIEKKYNVESKYIVALWAIETRCGDILGKYPLVNSLVTLSYDGRRPAFFEKELAILLKLIDEGKIQGSDNIKGSWAGAMGHFQFMPSSCAKHGVDYNGNGQINLRDELDDAFASAANYLSSSGWQYKTQLMQKVTVPTDLDLTSYMTSKKRLTIKEWKDLGVKLPRPIKKLDAGSKVRLLRLDPTKPNSTFLAYDNFDIIMQWNRSDYFATTVVRLANYIQTMKPTQSSRAQDGQDGTNGGDGGDGSHGHNQDGGHGGDGGSGLLKGGAGGRGGDAD